MLKKSEKKPFSFPRDNYDKEIKETKAMPEIIKHLNEELNLNDKYEIKYVKNSSSGFSLKVQLDNQDINGQPDLILVKKSTDNQKYVENMILMFEIKTPTAILEQNVDQCIFDLVGALSSESSNKILLIATDIETTYRFFWLNSDNHICMHTMTYFQIENKNDHRIIDYYGNPLEIINCFINNFQGKLISGLLLN